MAHEVEKPTSGPFLIVGVTLMLGSAFLLFAWATASVGVTHDRIIQYYFGHSFLTVRFDEVESAEVRPWGMRFTVGAGPYLSLKLNKKNGGLAGFSGLRSAAESTFQKIVQRYERKTPIQAREPTTPSSRGSP